MNKVPITKEGYEKLRKELDHLKTVSLPANIKDIETARAHGDLSENAEYSAAKEMQSFIHGKIQELENKLALCQVIDLGQNSCEEVVFGVTVIIDDIKTGAQIAYQLVGPYESDINENKISVTSPIGKALIGKTVGDTVVVKTPGGVRELLLVDICQGKKNNPAGG